MTTEWAHTLHEHLDTHREPAKNTWSQNKFATSENKPNKNRKIMSNSEIFAVQISLTAHPYYSISICKISFTSHFASLVLDTVTTEWAHTLHEHVNTHREGTKNSYSQNKLLSFAHLPNKFRKARLSPKT